MPPKLPGPGKPSTSTGTSIWDPHFGEKFVTTRPFSDTVKGVPGHWVFDKSNAQQNLPEPLAKTQLNGVQDLLLPNAAQGEAAVAAVGASATKMTAAQALYLFKNAPADIRANIQNMMYQSHNLYTGKYVPTPGAPLTQQDITAFRKFLMGEAANPSASSLGDALQQSADAGTTMGVGSTYNPLVETQTSPVDIRNVAETVGKQLHGTYLSPQQLDVFTAAYQTMEKAAQEQNYTAQGGNVATGMVNSAAQQVGAVVTKPPSVDAAAKDAIIKQNPQQFMANTFSDRMNEILQGFVHGPGNTPGGAVNPGGGY